MTEPDQDWLDALAGRSASGSNRGAAREGERLRDFI